MDHHCTIGIKVSMGALIGSQKAGIHQSPGQQMQVFPVSHEQKRTHASQGKWLQRHCTIGIKGSIGVQLGPIMPGYVSTSDNGCKFS